MADNKDIFMDKQMDSTSSFYTNQAERQLARLEPGQSNYEQHRIYQEVANNYFRAEEYELAIEHRMNEAECAYNLTERASANYYAAIACEKMQQWERAAGFYITGVECLSRWIERKNGDKNSKRDAVSAICKRRINTLNRAGECLVYAGNHPDAGLCFDMALGHAQELGFRETIEMIHHTMKKCGFRPGDAGQRTDPRP